MSKVSLRTGIDDGLQRYFQEGAPNGDSNFYIGLVMDDADDQRNGRLWVYIPGVSARRHDAESGAKPTYGGTPRDRETGTRRIDRESQEFRTGWIECYPIFPFFGSDDYRVRDGDKGRNAYVGDMASYGMCYQPRNGDLVGVLFAHGDVGRAFWIGCMPKSTVNFMVPGMAGSDVGTVNAEAGADIINKTDPENARIPTLEKKHTPDNRDQENQQTPKVPRYQNVYPATEFANNLLEAGLICDNERGAGLSSFRRESPSYVTGIKSQGWQYDSEKKNVNSATGDQFDQGGGTRDYPNVHTYGHQLVFDDHPEYQAVRLRSSAGSQILFNDSADRGNTPYIWINTPKGNVWIEIRDDGGLNIFAADSVSIHAEKNLNLTVDEDLNLQVGKNLNVNVDGKLDLRVNGEEPSAIEFKDQLFISNDASVDWKISGKMEVWTGGGLDIISAKTIAIGSGENFSISSNLDLQLKARTDIDLLATINMRAESMVNMDIKSGVIMRQSSGTEFMVKAGGNYAEQASKIFMNSGGVQEADSAKEATTPDSAIKIPEQKKKNVFSRPTQDQIYKCTKPDTDLQTIVPVVPQHLPWPNIVEDDSGFSGWVEVASEEQSRRGATSFEATAPTPMRGYVYGIAGVHRGLPYQTTSASEAPQYEFTDTLPDGELNPASVYRASDEIKAFIQRKERFVPIAYRDAGKAWAVGYGHNIVVGDVINGIQITQADITELDRSSGKQLRGGPFSITQEEAIRLFEKDLVRFEDAVRNNCTTEITQGQFDGMVSFTYNVGPDAYARSTMLKRVNEGQFQEVGNEFMKWVNATVVKTDPATGRKFAVKEVIPGLVTRRKEEYGFFVA